MTYTPEQQAFIDQTVAQMKSEIFAMADEGRFQPDEVQSFGDLHSFCDANTLGGMCDESEGETLKGLDLIATIFPDPAGSPDYGTMNSQAGMDACNHMQDLVDAWIKTRPIFEGFGDEATETHVINPTCSECGRFPVSPSTYGFKEYSTGGGFMAWERTLPDGTQCLVTNLDNGVELVAGEKFLLGIYNNETGEEIAMYEGMVGQISPLRKAAQ